MRYTPVAALACAMVGLALTGGEILAQEEEVDRPGAATAAGPEAGAWHWGLSSGYGRGVDISSQATYLGDVRFIGVTPALGRERADPFFRDRWFGGRAGFLVEGAFLPALRPRPGFGLGASLNARFVSATSGRWVPFLLMGAGPIYLDFNNENQADGLNFILQGGGGLEQRLTGTLSLLTQIRMHHISNAGTRKPNPGINDILVLMGFSHHLR